MSGPQTRSDNGGYETVAVCRSEDPDWRLEDWREFDEADLDSTHLVKADELLVRPDAGRRPDPAAWEETDEAVPGFVLYRRREGASQNAKDRGETPMSGIRVMREAGADPGIAPNAVFCSQGLRATNREEIGPFRVAPAYQGLGNGPRPPDVPYGTVGAPPLVQPTSGRRITVGVIDTGLAQGRFFPSSLEPFVVARCLVQADTEDPPDFDLDGRLDAVAGHGTLVAGTIARAEPQVLIQMVRAVDKQGAVTDTGLATAIETLLVEQGGAPDILNLSLGGWTWDDEEPPAIADKLRELHGHGTAIVAAAGNLASTRKFWPAAMPEVIGVGAVKRRRAEWVATSYSNRGSWIDAAVEARPVVGTFFENFTSKPDETEPESPAITFAGSVQWEGTSFLAPQVAGSIARLMRRERLSPHAAWQRLADSATNSSPSEMPEARVFTRELLDAAGGAR